MNVRKIMRVGNSDCVIIPAEIMRALSWNLGDYIAVQTSVMGCIILQKFTPPQLTDEIINAAKPSKEIIYE